jgi:hypothetical protein
MSSLEIIKKNKTKVNEAPLEKLLMEMELKHSVVQESEELNFPS